MDCPRDVARARAVLGWAVLGFVVLQLGFTAVVDGWFPLFYDLESTQRNRQLRACLAERPARPLLLLMGSSRTTMSFRPEVVGPLRDPSGAEVLVFNYSHLGSTPPFHLLQLQRLLNQGIRPRWLVLELMPAFLSSESNSLLIKGAVLPELRTAARYMPAWKLLTGYAARQLLPWYRNRGLLLMQLAPDFLPPDYPDRKLGPMGPLGWDNRVWKGEIGAREVRRRTDLAKRDYEPMLRDFRIKERPLRALCEFLGLCEREKIELVLVLTPESKEFQGWYSPEALAQIDFYCRALSGVAGGVPVVDGRNWLSEDAFMDGHHVLPHGADEFSRCLEREVLRPLVTSGHHALPGPETASARH
jgi:hypothetical protein